MVHWAEHILESDQGYFFSTLEGALVHRRALPEALNLLVSIYTPGWRESL